MRFLTPVRFAPRRRAGHAAVDAPFSLGERARNRHAGLCYFLEYFEGNGSRYESRDSCGHADTFAGASREEVRLVTAVCRTEGCDESASCGSHSPPPTQCSWETGDETRA